MNVHEKFIWKVCVRCFTYNQSSYIVDALNSFCIQETNFPFVCTIVDDASTDGEPEVIKQYLNIHFDLSDQSIVRKEETDNYYLIFAQHKTNKNCFFAVLFLKYNHKQIKKAKHPYLNEWNNNSQFIAICEGDDYWIDCKKLQKQVDALDAHPEVDMCACAASRIKNGKEELRIAPANCESIIPVEKVILGGGGFVATNSLMYRSSFDKMPNNAYNLMKLDYFLQIGGSQRGGLLFLPDCMSVYRFGEKGSWTKRMNKNSHKFFYHHLRVFKSMVLFDEKTGFQYSDAIREIEIDLLFSLFRCGLVGGYFSNKIDRLSFLGRMHFSLDFFKKVFLKIRNN